MKTRCDKCRGTKTMLDCMMEKPCNKCGATGWLTSDGQPYAEAVIPETKEFDQWCKDNNVKVVDNNDKTQNGLPATETIIDEPLKPDISYAEAEAIRNKVVELKSKETIILDNGTVAEKISSFITFDKVFVHDDLSGVGKFDADNLPDAPIVNINSSDSAEEVKAKTLEALSQLNEPQDAPKPRRGRPPKGAART